MADNMQGEWQEILDRLFAKGALLQGQTLIGSVRFVTLEDQLYLSLYAVVEGRDILVPVSELSEKGGVLYVDTGDEVVEVSSRLSESHYAQIEQAGEAW